METTSHRWRFFRAGGLDQVRLDDAASIAGIATLDQKLWVALSCPTKGLELDEKTLAMIDSDGDQRIRPPELIAAVEWTRARLKDLGELTRGSGELPLASIDTSRPEGKLLLDAAKRVLTNVGKPDAKVVRVEDTLETKKIFADAKLNGDGIIPPAAIDDPAQSALAKDVLDTVGGDLDRVGTPGVSKAKLEAMLADAKVYSEWWFKAEASPEILPLGPATQAAYDAYEAVRAKVSDWFARAKLAAFDARAVAAVARDEKELAALASGELGLAAPEAAAFPIARIAPGGALPLVEGVNPAWAERVERFRAQVVAPIFGKEAAVLSEADFVTIGAKLAAHTAWRGAKAGASVEKLGIERVREILGGGAKDSLLALIAADEALRPEMDAIASVERLARYYRDLHRLLSNFVNFSELYSRERAAIFQAGTLYLDARSCQLCVRVDDAAKHSTLAVHAKAYLAYCDLNRTATGEKMTIAAAFTDGDSDNLSVGRNGVFYDRKGKDWDATITKIVDNPISVRAAFWAPYKKAIKIVEEQVAKRAAAAEGESDTKLAGVATAVAHTDRSKLPPLPPAPAPAAPPAPPPPKKMDVGTVAAIGVAFGSISAAIGAFLGAFLGLGMWMPIGLVGLLLAISLPSMLIAWLKLRQRNLAPILDANGWAVNGRVKINVPFGAALTGVAKLPPGSERAVFDPYADKKRRWPVILLMLIVLAIAAYVLYATGRFPGMQ